MSAASYPSDDDGKDEGNSEEAPCRY